MKNMIEGKGHGKKLLEIIEKKREFKIKIPLITTTANLLRAISLSNDKTKIKDLKKIIEFTKVFPNMVDFKDEKKVVEETIKFAKYIIKRKEK